MVDKDFQLRDYQKEALDAILQNMQGLVVLPTGAGKTVIGIALIKSLQQKYDEVEYYILVPTLALVEQWYSALVRNKIPTALGNVMTYSSFISLASRSSSVFGKTTLDNVIKNSHSRTTVIIIDESHHAHIGTKLWDAVQKAHPKYLVGFTATPNPLKAYDLKVIYKRSVSDISKYIAELEVKKVPITLDSDDKSLFENDVRELGYLFTKRERALRDGNMQQLLAVQASIDALLADISLVISTDPNVIEATVNKAIDLYKNTNDRILIKTQRVSIAIQIRNMILSKLNIQHDKILFYQKKTDISRLYKQDWRILIVVNALSEGIDIPDLTYAILSAYPYRSIIYMVQIIGRILRKSPTKNKAVAYILVPDVPQYEQAYNNLLKYLAGA